MNLNFKYFEIEIEVYFFVVVCKWLVLYKDKEKKLYL